ncbi:MAG: sodium-dependent transporter [Calditrichia bacterium]
MAIERNSWGSRIGLILAMAGNAVGLGNFLRFPVQAIRNGGGAFIIPYLISFLLMGLPLLWVEWALGKYGSRFGDHASPFIFDRMGKGRFWKYLGVFGIFSNFGVAAYYVYIESWTFSFVWFSVFGSFSGLSESGVSHFFDKYVNINPGMVNLPVIAFLFFLLTLFINITILSKGLNKGIERASKIGMPLLLLFGVLLAIRAVTLRQGVEGATFDSAVGLNFLWQPQLKSLYNPDVWLAAAGQIFFTLSLGMGTIVCYASYLDSRDDIALNAMSAGWMNEFVEIVLGASIVIPIAVGYMGLDWVKANAGFMMGFKTMPYLFQQWGPFLAALSGVLWFGLLFFAGITSSLAFGTPWMAMMQDEFNWDRKKSAYTFGLLILLLALPCIFFFQAGVFDEYDYWTGTVSLVFFALIEIILFAWVYGIDNGWQEITGGADISVPQFFKKIIKYVTPLFIAVVFIGSLIEPAGGEWIAAFKSLFAGHGWPFDAASLVSKVFHLSEKDTRWFINGRATTIFIIDMSRVLLTLAFLGIALVVKLAMVRRKRLQKNENLDGVTS